MSAPLTLTLRQPLRQRVDMSPLVPDKLAGLKRDAVAALTLNAGAARVRVADLFELSGEQSDHLIFANADGHFDYVGAGMKCGTLQVNGDVGDFLGSAPAGERVGMRGGLILVKGSAGERAADRQRRGVILIEGDVGYGCAARMIAGTLAVLGRVGDGLGIGMRRGTVLVRQFPVLPATFNDEGCHDLSFLALLLASFRSLDSRFASLRNITQVRRWVGDRACGGQGEILLW